MIIFYSLALLALLCFSIYGLVLLLKKRPDKALPSFKQGVNLRDITSEPGDCELIDLPVEKRVYIHKT